MALLLRRSTKNYDTNMLKRTLFLCLAICSLSSLQAQGTTQPAAAEYDSTYIEAFLEGIPAGTTKLVGMWGDQNYIIDSTKVDAAGHFILRRNKLMPTGFYTFLLPGMKQMSILVDKDQRMTLRAKASDIFGTMQVEGSLNTQLFYESIVFQNKQEPEMSQTAGIMNKAAVNSP
ncbi:MAG: hypothetical protein IT261_05545, partial [Saprospiraceae bacterium]|nr:hypothetical protein [Saprospiraceae bacterium]